MFSLLKYQLIIGNFEIESLGENLMNLTVSENTITVIYAFI